MSTKVDIRLAPDLARIQQSGLRVKLLGCQLKAAETAPSRGCLGEFTGKTCSPSQRTWQGFALVVLLVPLCPIVGCNCGPSGEFKPSTNNVATVISIRTSAGAAVPFTPTGPPQLEIVNDHLNLALTSREGMIFQFTGIPAKDGLAARRYRGDEFRALLLHSGFQEEAALGDLFKETSKLEILQRTSEKGGAVVEFHYHGKLRAGSETLEVQLQCSGLLPANREFLTPNQKSPSLKTE